MICLEKRLNFDDFTSLIFFSIRNGISSTTKRLFMFTKLINQYFESLIQEGNKFLVPQITSIFLLTI